LTPETIQIFFSGKLFPTVAYCELFDVKPKIFIFATDIKN